MCKDSNLKPRPPIDCPICPRLYQFRQANKQKFPSYFNQPVPIFIPKAGLESTKLLIIGLAPGLHGANRTGRPFTADYAGDLLYSTLIKFGFAEGKYEAHINDSLKLNQTAIVNAVRCVPPQNKPLGGEINNCRIFFAPLLNLPNLTTILTLGTIAHNSCLRALNLSPQIYKFAHNKLYQVTKADNSKKLNLISSYHCSRYNTNTGKLTTTMFEQIFDTIISVN